MMTKIIIGIIAFCCGYAIANLINDDDPWNDGFGW